MDIYKLKAIGIILIVYLVSMLPSFIIFLLKKDIKSKKSFINLYCVCTLIEVLIFSLIYIFSKNIIGLLPLAKNVEKYAIYTQKIVFSASIFTIMNFAYPIYLFKNEKKKKAVTLFSLRFLYIPILVIINFAFSTKIALFTIPVLDLIYSIFLLIQFIYY